MRSEQEKEEAREKVELKQLQDIEDIRFIMDNEKGRRFIFKLLCRARIYQCSFNGQSNQTIFNEGGRNQGLMLQSEIMTHAPGSYQLMLKENENA